ncbi:ABC transporter permease [Bacillus massilinigeriensis]|uniref:ABC transporter permease n=1 Tax=Bacillus massilionigeriensis TaxID=1805475 RepID=UPI000B1AC220|nr:ABC transporter permease [Bacillus massilionigeriensis]
MQAETMKKATIITNRKNKNNLIYSITRNRKALFSFLLLLIFIIIGLIGPFIITVDPNKSDINELLQSPSSKHPFGTDALGRDVFTRIIYGTRITITVALLAVAITVTIGTFLGVMSAYLGGFVDNLISRITEIFLALPGIVLALAIVAVLGPSLTNAMIAVGIASIPGFTRLIRGTTLSIIQSGYVEASRSIGSSSWWIIFHQIIPNITSILIVYTTLAVGGAILETSALSYIGLGAQPPTPEWGAMLNEGSGYLTEAWWLSIFPGISITVIVFAINSFGDALRDIYDPKAK